MNIDTLITNRQFKKAFEKLGWIYSRGKTGKYDIWTNPNDKNIWTIVPNELSSPDYKYYQLQNIKILLFALDLEENRSNINYLCNQLLGYSYRLINRIINKENSKFDSVPYELATILPSKNIDSFRYFYRLKTKGKTTIPIEKIELNHTQYGSFIIPISIPITNDNEEEFDTIPSKTNSIIREYLEKIDLLTTVSREDEKKYADKLIDEEIDSKIVKDFLSKSDSIAKFKTKYQDSIKDISISSESNPILDFKLNIECKHFKEVDLGGITILPDEFIEYLEKREVEADSSNISDFDADIEAEVDSIDVNGTAKFRILAINGEVIKKPFKATATELPKVKQDFCADAFKSRDTVLIKGDILKQKSKMGKVVVDTFSMIENENYPLFNEL